MIAVGGNSTRENRFDRLALIAEAERCLYCYDAPCRAACPAEVPVPEFIRSLASGNFRRAAELVRSANPMIAVCGEVCPAETFCQASCTRNKIDRAIEIRYLHAFVSKFDPPATEPATLTGAKVAVVGSGPAAVSCAVKLAEAGYSVTCFERSPKLGGVPALNIPGFRLADPILRNDLDRAAAGGVIFHTQSRIDDPRALLGEYEAVFVATGLPREKKTGIAGENLEGVIGSLEFLEKAKNGEIRSLTGRQVVIIGGGNVSLDTAAVAADLGAASVRLLYRRGPLEMKVWRAELESVQKRGIVIDYLTAPLEFIGEKGKLAGVVCARTMLAEKRDSSGRRTPVIIDSSAYKIAADIAVISIGLYSDYCPAVAFREDTTSSVPGLFAGGDLARGEGTIVEAVRDGKLAARRIIEYLKETGRV